MRIGPLCRTRVAIAVLTVGLSGCRGSERDSAPAGVVVLPTPVSVGLATAHRRIQATVNPRRVQFDPGNDERLLVMESNGDLQIWHVPPSWAAIVPASGEPAVGDADAAQLLLTIAAQAVDARYSADGAAIFVGDTSGAVSLWRSDGQRLWMRQTDGAAVRAVATHGDLLACGSADGELLVWRHDGSLAHRRPLAHDGAVLSLAFSEAGDVLLSEGTDTLLRSWRVHDGDSVLTELASYRAPDDRFSAMLPSLIRLDVQWGWDRAVAFIPGRDAFAYPTFDAGLRVQRSDGELLHERARAHGEYHLRAIAVSPDGALIATGGFNMEGRVWSTEGLVGPTILKGHHRVVTGVAFDRSGRIASASLDGTVRLWSTSGKKLGTLPHKGPPRRRHGPGERRRRRPPPTPLPKPGAASKAMRLD